MNADLMVPKLELWRQGGSAHQRGGETLPYSIDYVVVYDVHEISKTKQRELFEAALKRRGLHVEKMTVGQKVFVKIHCPFDLLCREAETVKLEMPLRDCPIYNEESGLLARLERYFNTDEEVDFVSGPFIKEKLHCYEGSDTPAQFFRSSIRSLLVHHMLINLDSSSHILIDSESVEPRIKQGLLTLISKGVYKDAFILHDQSKDDPHYLKIKNKFPDIYKAIMNKLDSYMDARHELNVTWRKIYKFQPLWRIRYYFGEELAFYFAWHGYLISCLWVPAILGLLLFSHGFYNALVATRRNLCYCTLNTTFVDVEETFRNETITEECERENGLIKVAISNIFWVIRDSFNNDYNSYFSLFICLWSSVFLELWKRKQSTLAYEWDCNNYDDTEPDRPEFVGTEVKKDPITKEHIYVFPEFARLKRIIISSVVILLMMCCVFLTLAGVILFKVWCRVYLNCPRDTENLQQIKEDCIEKKEYNAVLCIMVGTLLPAAASAISVLAWESIYAIVAEKLVNFENYQTKSDHNNALITKLFIFEFVNSYSILFYIALIRPSNHHLQDGGIFNLGAKYRDTCENEGCLSLLALQVLLLMIAKPTAKFCTDVILPWIQKRIRVIRRTFQSRKVASSFGKGKRNSSVAGLDEPGHYLTRECQKPPVDDFCLWEFNEKIIQFGYIVMFASSFPLAPFIALMVNLFDLRIDARRLLWFNRRPVSFISKDIGRWFSILRFVNFCGIVSNAILVASATMFTRERSTEYKLMSMIGFEHILFVLVFLIDVIIPDMPHEIKQSMRREKYQVAKVLEAGEVPGSRPSDNQSEMSSYRTRLSRPPSCRSLIETDIFAEAFGRMSDPRLRYQTIHKLLHSTDRDDHSARPNPGGRRTIFSLGVMPQDQTNEANDKDTRVDVIKSLPSLQLDSSAANLEETQETDASNSQTLSTNISSQSDREEYHIFSFLQDTPDRDSRASALNGGLPFIPKASVPDLASQRVSTEQLNSKLSKLPPNIPVTTRRKFTR